MEQEPYATRILEPRVAALEWAVAWLIRSNARQAPTVDLIDRVIADNIQPGGWDEDDADLFRKEFQHILELVQYLDATPADGG